jgi:acetyl esterase/lipase
LGGALLAAALAVPASASATLPVYREVAYGPSAGEKATVFGQLKPGSTIVVLVHGGGWRLQKYVTEEGSPSKALQKQGFMVFDVNYDQDSPTQPAFPLEVDEVAEATTYAIEHAEAWGGNPANVVLLGGSAGGQLAARAAEVVDQASPGAVRGVVSLSGPMNLVTLVQMAIDGTLTDHAYIKSIGQALGCSASLAACSTSFAAEWSPAVNIPTVSCPAWLLVSSEVDVVATLQADEMLADLGEAGCSAAHVELATGHGFSYWSTIAPQVYSFVKSN